MHKQNQHLLSNEDLLTLGACFEARRKVDRGQEICTSANHIHIVLDGCSGRQRILRSGHRQLIRLHFAGEICDIDRLHCADVPYGACALNQCLIATIPLSRLQSVTDTHRSIRGVLWASAALDNVALTNQIVNLGRRPVRERLARLFCELVDRLGPKSTTPANTFRLELTQTDLADYLGLSLVHINRNLQALKGQGLIQSCGQVYTILDLPGLQAAAGFTGEIRSVCDAQGLQIAATILASADMNRQCHVDVRI